MELVNKELKQRNILFCCLNTARKPLHMSSQIQTWYLKGTESLVLWFKTNGPEKFKVNANIVVLKDYRTHCFHSICCNRTVPEKASDLGGNRRKASQKAGSRYLLTAPPSRSAFRIIRWHERQHSQREEWPNQVHITQILIGIYPSQQEKKYVVEYVSE